MFEKTNRILAFVAVTLTILGIFYTPLYYSEESYGQGDLVQYNQGWVWEKGNEDIPVNLRNPIKTMDHQVVIKRNLDHFMSYNGSIGFFLSKKCSYSRRFKAIAQCSYFRGPKQNSYDFQGV